MQYFKGDYAERKFDDAARPMTETILQQRKEFFEGAYSCFKLGEVLWDTGRAPLAKAIPREIYREVFSTLFESFLFAGTFESYLSVFRNIFGDNVLVEFTVPGPGKLNISVEAQGTLLFDWIAPLIENDVLIPDEVIDDEGDNIAFPGIKGFESQEELEQMLFEMVPNGIYTEISLTFGG